MEQKIIGLGFGPGGCINVGDTVFSGKQKAVIASIVDNSVEYPDALHRIYVAYSVDNQMITSYENCAIEVYYEVREERKC